MVIFRSWEARTQASGSRARPRLPAKDPFAAGRAGRAEAEFFEASGNFEPILRRYGDCYRHQPRQHLGDQRREYALAAMLGSDAGVAQFENFMLGIMSLEQLRID